MAPPEQGVEDASRRTWLAAERTWLAWWRSGLTVAAVAIAVGRLLPGVTKGSHWPFQALGIGYALLAVLTLLVGAWRQHRAAEALRRGAFDELTAELVAWLTAAAVILSGATVVIIAVTF